MNVSNKVALSTHTTMNGAMPKWWAALQWRAKDIAMASGTLQRQAETLQRQAETLQRQMGTLQWQTDRSHEGRNNTLQYLMVDALPWTAHHLCAVGTGNIAIILNPIAPAGLGLLPHHDGVMKRPYHTSGTGNTTGDKSKIQINRYILRQELEKLFREANVLYWAGSLRWVSSTALMVRMLVVSAQYPRECSPFLMRLCWVVLSLAKSGDSHNTISAWDHIYWMVYIA